MISASLCLLQQAIGQPTVLAYASRLIKMNSAFQSSTRLALMVSLLPGGVKVLATALSGMCDVVTLALFGDGMHH
jgi:hypothetical protein